MNSNMLRKEKVIMSPYFLCVVRFYMNIKFDGNATHRIIYIQYHRNIRILSRWRMSVTNAFYTESAAEPDTLKTQDCLSMRSRVSSIRIQGLRLQHPHIRVRSMTHNPAALNGANARMVGVITGRTSHQEASTKWHTFNLVKWVWVRLQWDGYSQDVRNG